MKKYTVKLSADIQKSLRARRNKILQAMYIITSIVFLFISFMDSMNTKPIDASIELITFIFVSFFYYYLYKMKKYELAAYCIVFLIAIATLVLIHVNHFDNYSPIFIIPTLLVTFFLFDIKSVLILNSLFIFFFILGIVINIQVLDGSHFLSNKQSIFNFFLVLSIMAVFIYFAEQARVESYKMLLDLSEKKDLLYKELHHRVKNNLNIVSSMLAMQALGTSRETQDLLSVSKSRIDSIAMVHSMLYVTNNLEKVNVKQYIEELILNLKKTTSLNIDIFKKIQNVELSLNEIIPLGLILTELLTNSFKYAFIQEKKPKIVIVLRIIDNKVMLNYYDNGPGIVNKNENLGLKLVKLNVQQLKGHLSVKNHNGLVYKIKYERDKYV